MAKILLISRTPHNLAVSLIRNAGHEAKEVLTYKTGLEEARHLPYDSLIVAEYGNIDGDAPDFMRQLEVEGLCHRVIVHSRTLDGVNMMKAHECRLFATYLQTATFDRMLIEKIDRHLPGLRDRTILPGTLFQQAGESARLLMVNIGKVGPLDVNVAISGEAGLGKERIVKALHEHSGRSHMPIRFVHHDKYIINSDCQNDDKECYLHRCFREAQGGTIALIDLPNFCKKGQAILYSKLRDPGCNVRIVATADKNVMREKVRAGEFNANLWFEISQGMIDLPPLRDCPDNIEWLARTLLNQFCISHNRPPLSITDEAIMILKAFAWPGNVIQLNSILIRKALLCEADSLGVSDFVDLIEMDTERSDESDIERLSRILDTSPTVEVAARRYGKSVRTVYNRMSQYKMDCNGKFSKVV